MCKSRTPQLIGLITADICIRHPVQNRPFEDPPPRHTCADVLAGAPAPPLFPSASLSSRSLRAAATRASTSRRLAASAASSTPAPLPLLAPSCCRWLGPPPGHSRASRAAGPCTRASCTVSTSTFPISSTMRCMPADAPAAPAMALEAEPAEPAALLLSPPCCSLGPAAPAALREVTALPC